MSGKRDQPRDAHGRFAAGPRSGTELKRGSGAEARPQVRAKHKNALTEREIEIFLSTLAETCNVSLSAREAKRRPVVFHDLKRRDPAFRAAWVEALREGYDRLDLELAHRARFGTPREVFYRGRKTATTRVFNDGLALRLLQFHRKTVEPLRAADSGRRDGDAIFDELAARLAEIKADKAARAAKDRGTGNGGS